MARCKAGHFLLASAWRARSRAEKTARFADGV